VIFALFALGYLFGFVGLLIAVPVAAAIGVLVRFALRQYFASPFYLAAPHSNLSALAIGPRTTHTTTATTALGTGSTTTRVSSNNGIDVVRVGVNYLFNFGSVPLARY
jgi:hypothetical protein